MGLQVLEQQDPQGPPSEEEPQEYLLDCPLPEEAQEGNRGGCFQEEKQKDPEVPESCGWSHPPGHHGQEEPEARGQEGPERAGSESCQGSQEGRQQGRQERAEVRPQGRWQEINPD